jgi:hypothetical protein
MLSCLRTPPRAIGCEGESAKGAGLKGCEGLEDGVRKGGGM